MYKDNSQLRMEDFIFPYGKLDPENDWVKLAALIGLFIGKLSEGLMIGVVYIKITMLVFIAVPIVCALVGVSGPLAVICNIVPSHPAFDGIMALSARSIGTAIKDVGILAIHCVSWFALYVLISTQREKQS